VPAKNWNRLPFCSEYALKDASSNSFMKGKSKESMATDLPVIELVEVTENQGNKKRILALAGILFYCT
jgi:hypothetical protein